MAGKAHGIRQRRTGSVQRFTQHLAQKHDQAQAAREELATGKDLGKQPQNICLTAKTDLEFFQQVVL